MGSEYQIELDIIALDLESKYLIQSDLFHSTEYSKVQLLLYTNLRARFKASSLLNHPVYR